MGPIGRTAPRLVYVQMEDHVMLMDAAYALGVLLDHIAILQVYKLYVIYIILYVSIYTHFQGMMDIYICTDS